MIRRAINRFGLVIILLAVSLPSGTNAQETIVWPYICYKPIYICEENRLTGGSGFYVYSHLQERLTGYRHVLLQMPIKRVIESAKKGRHQIFYGLYKTPEREASMHFSIPCRISTPTFIVVRKADLATLGKSRRVSLRSLLNNDRLTFLHLQSISFGKPIDDLISANKNRANVITEYDTTDICIKSFKLLMNHRIDYFLSLDGSHHDSLDLGIEDQIAYLTIAEQDQWDVGYITAPKNEWGRRIIQRINAILREIIPTEAFMQLFVPLVSRDNLPALRRAFEQKLVAPLRSAKDDETHKSRISTGFDEN